MPTPEAIALNFVAAINAADLTTLRELMTGDHTFTDARSLSFTGADKMIAGWQYFFQAFPNYRIHIDHTFTQANRVALFGHAQGGWRIDGKILPGNWRVNAAWLAEIADSKVHHWTVFCDTAWAAPPTP